MQGGGEKYVDVFASPLWSNEFRTKFIATTAGPIFVTICKTFVTNVQLLLFH